MEMITTIDESVKDKFAIFLDQVVDVSKYSARARISINSELMIQEAMNEYPDRLTTL